MLLNTPQYVCPTNYRVIRRTVIIVSILVLLGCIGSFALYHFSIQPLAIYDNSLKLHRCRIDSVQNETYTVQLVGTNITIITTSIYPYYSDKIVDCWFKPPDQIFMPDNPVSNRLIGFILGFAAYILIILSIIGYAIIRILVKVTNEGYEELA